MQYHARNAATKGATCQIFKGGIKQRPCMSLSPFYCHNSGEKGGGGYGISMSLKVEGVKCAFFGNLKLL